MKCPNCQTKMHIVKTPSINKGLFVELDQCPNCGGLWSDRFEMVQVPPDEAYKIDSLNEQLLRQPFPENVNLNCPKDNQPLVAITDPSIPENTHIGRCRQCEGIWMNRGELAKYKEHVAKRQAALEETEPEEEYPRPSWMTDHAVDAVFKQILPLPLNLIPGIFYDSNRQPLTISDHQAEILKIVPEEKKIEIYKLLAEQHNQSLENEHKFINATLNILNIFYSLLRFVTRL